MNIITIDFETYYDKAFSLSKITTEEYVRSDMFEVIGVAVAVNDADPVWFSGTHDETKQWLSKFDWANSFALAHNMQFDGSIMSWLFDIKPKGWLDTLCMARAIHGVDAGGSLKALAERYQLGEKGTEVINALGKRRYDFTDEDLERYGAYCRNDVVLTRTLFHVLMMPGLGKNFPTKELKVIDLTLRMFLEPTLELSLPLLEAHLENVKDKKAKLLVAAEADKESLMSNDKFAELLKQLGVLPPVKVSARTGKDAWAFAKTDEEFKALLEHPDPRVQILVSARLGNKTTLEETRTQRFIDISLRGKLPVPIKYYAAHTGRWGGDDKINLQNLPSRGNNAGRLKASILPPEGYVIIDCDSSQIEARTVAWLAGQTDLVEAFDRGEDVYKIMASSIYGKDVSEITKEQRFVGKTVVLGCFGPDTKVLTGTGWKRIVEVQLTDTVWDGEEWVTHQGVVPQGMKETITARGLTATPDHEILTERGWREWSEVATSPTLFQSAISKGSLKYCDGSNTTEPQGALLGGIQLSDAVVGGKVRSTAITLKQAVLPDAINVQKAQLHLPVKSTGGMSLLSPILSIGNAYSIGLQVVLGGAITPALKPTLAMAVEGSSSILLGGLTEQPFSNTLYRLTDGKTPNAISIGSTILKDTSRAILGLLHAVKTHVTGGQFVQCKKKLMTYDIAYAGPRNRYTVATDAGPIIVHNCGYGMGSAKFQLQLKGFGVDVELEECKRIIDVYRRAYPAITALWQQGRRCLEAIITNKAAEFGAVDVVQFDAREYGFKLPSGLWQRYDGLQKVLDSDGKEQYEYRTRKGPVKIYGGKVVENLCQAIARCVIAEQMIRIAKRYKVVLTVHDAVACIAPEAEAEQAQKYVEECMRWRPDWAATLPLNCESGIGKNYGEC